MSILLRYWDMPPRCIECPCVSIGGARCMSETRYEVYTCKAIDKKLDNINVVYERDKDCPLIEVPDTYEIKTRSLTDEERKSYLKALKKDAVQTGGKLYSTDDNDFKSYISNIMNEFSKVEYKETNGLEE